MDENVLYYNSLDFGIVIINGKQIKNFFNYILAKNIL